MLNRPAIKGRVTLAGAALLYLLVAVLASLMRFGEFENAAAGGGDSPFYADMANVFAGRSPRFDGELLEQGQAYYNRPLAPFLAAMVMRVVAACDVGSAFSVVNILAAWGIAFGYAALIKSTAHAISLWWVPSLCFLVAFPQLNWGYHVLTDTVGLLTALGAYWSAFNAMRLVALREDVRWGVAVAQGSYVFLLGSAAFLARETAYIFLVAAVWTAFTLVRQRRGRSVFVMLVVVAAISAKLPHFLYTSYFGLQGMPRPMLNLAAFGGSYVIDAAVKAAVAFTLAWPLALLWLRRHNWRIVPTVDGWTIGAVAYAVYGYLLMARFPGGYTPRAVFVVFPGIFLYVVMYLERLPTSRRFWSTLAFVFLFTVTSVVGVLLDPSSPTVTVKTLLRERVSNLGDGR